MALRRTAGDVPTDGGEPRQRARFMAILGLTSSALFALTIVGGRDPAMGARCLPVASPLLLVVYARRRGPRLAQRRLRARHPSARSAAFACGWLALVVALSPPLDE